MNTSESFRALRRANPRANGAFTESVEAVAATVRAQLGDADPPFAPVRARRRLAGLSAAASLAAAAVVAAALILGSQGGTGVGAATAAVRNAAALTAASAERSGIAVVRITHEGRLWSGATIQWHGDDLALTQDTPDRQGRVGSKTLVVDGTMYGIDPEQGGWVELGSTKSIDPGSGTTPDEYLAAVREDVGGTTLRRIVGDMTAAATSHAEGSTVYSGKVAAGLIARESGFKQGQAIRVFPFGYVAHDEAADPAARLDTAVTVGTEGVVRELTVTWGSWTYTVTYRGLGKTPAPSAPADARPLRRR